MFFLFYILVILIINLQEIHSFALRENKFNRNVNSGKSQENFQDVRESNERNMLSTKPFFQIIQNMTNTKISNLKYNIFDKMLSDEMLSIKRQFQEKDLSYIPVQIITNVSVQTPTLEIKQKWTAVDYEYTTTNYIRDVKNITKQIINAAVKEEDNAKTANKNVVDEKLTKKALGLRSLHHITAIPAHVSHLITSNKSCTSMKTNPFAICSHKHTAISEKCTHTSGTTKRPQCTQTLSSLPTFSSMYVPYQTYFIGLPINTPNKHSDYYNDERDDYELKIKEKHKTKPYNDADLYYEETEDTVPLKVIDNNKYYNYDYFNNKAVTLKPFKIDVSKNIINNVDYDDNAVKIDTINKDTINLNMDNLNQDKLVNDIVNDLRKFYSDIVIKDCYCSSESKIYRVSVMCILLRSFLSLLRGLYMLKVLHQ
ncbi:uncharacterized protein LOC116413289 [Galleria mellonella]|uniref:Uncharacterized protein LOC116413289 n=1 Tax=Galleria mellonella TaxID=7137 RepID=A0ABM3MDN9_GALME|nr:uncharacterized protein LOC116413289 [Galleria mellonella]